MVQMIITVENEDQYQAILDVLQDSEEEAVIDFPFNVEKVLTSISLCGTESD